MHARDSLQGARLRKLKRSEFDILVRQGCFEGERVELLRGKLVEMSPVGRAHAFAVNRLNRLLTIALDGRAQVRPQQPFAAKDESEPEPDLAVVPSADYLEDHPARAFLLIEVADSSLWADRSAKRTLYADSEVPEYWIVNLVDEVIEVYRDPHLGAYRASSVHRRGDSIPIPGFPDVLVPVAEVLPPAAPNPARG